MGLGEPTVHLSGLELEQDGEQEESLEEKTTVTAAWVPAETLKHWGLLSLEKRVSKCFTYMRVTLKRLVTCCDLAAEGKKKLPLTSGGGGEGTHSYIRHRDQHDRGGGSAVKERNLAPSPHDGEKHLTPTCITHN